MKTKRNNNKLSHHTTPHIDYSSCQPCAHWPAILLHRSTTSTTTALRVRYGGIVFLFENNIDTHNYWSVFIYTIFFFVHLLLLLMLVWLLNYFPIVLHLWFKTLRSVVSFLQMNSILFSYFIMFRWVIWWWWWWWVIFSTPTENKFEQMIWVQLKFSGSILVCSLFLVCWGCWRYY